MGVVWVEVVWRRERGSLGRGCWLLEVAKVDWEQLSFLREMLADSAVAEKYFNSTIQNIYQPVEKGLSTI